MLTRMHDAAPTLSAEAARFIRDRADGADRGEHDLVAELDALAACGLGTAVLPAAEGGLDFGADHHSILDVCDTLRAVGRASLSVGRLFEGHVNAAKLVSLYGTADQVRAMGEAVRGGAWLGVWGADGQPPTAIEGDRLSGTKRFASGLGHISRAVVSIHTPEGLRLCLADVSDPKRADASTWRVGGMRATASGTFSFDGLPFEPLGAVGDYVREPYFEGGVWRYSAVHLGGAEALHDEMVALLTRMKREADPYQAHRIAGCAIALDTARMWIERAALRVEGDAERDVPDPQGAAAVALLAREVTERSCLEVLHTVEKALGTIAHSADLSIERIRRDLGLFLRQANPDGKLTGAAAALVARGGRADAL